MWLMGTVKKPFKFIRECENAGFCLMWHKRAALYLKLSEVGLISRKRLFDGM